MCVENKKEEAINLLLVKYKEINSIPKKTDFPIEKVMFIKAQLGPWPRALEAAGIKTPAKLPRSVQNKRKRRDTKERKKQYEMED